jgi:hypothetical protein
VATGCRRGSPPSAYIVLTRGPASEALADCPDYVSSYPPGRGAPSGPDPEVGRHQLGGAAKPSAGICVFGRHRDGRR